MNSLNAFLNPVSVDDTKSVVISERFRGEDGKPVPFVIKAITQAENNRLIKRATTAKVVRGQRVDSFDNEMYTNSLILACTIEPDFSNAELCKAYGTMDPMEVPACMLLSGEFSKLSEEILKLNRFNIDELPEIEEDAKN